MEKTLFIGAKFNKLTVLNKTERKDANRNSYYMCQCECGNTSEVRSTFLRNGHTKSCGCLNVEPPGEASWNKVFWDYQLRARKKKLEFSLTREQFKALAQQDCYYCGDIPRSFNVYGNAFGMKRIKGNTENMVARSWILTNGIDRINNLLGYNVSNCVPCCTTCNSFKSDYTQEEFLNHSRKITEFQLRKETL
jgi:hypothetical protein